MTRTIRRVCVALVALVAAVAVAQPQNPPVSGPVEAVPLTDLRVVDQVNAAIDRGLEWVASKQKRDGSWHNNQAVNGLALLSYMGRGHVPGRGRYPDVLERAKRFMLASANPQTGYVSFNSMYEHGLATLALAEMYGMDPDPELEKAVRKAVELIEKSQSPRGGWRYAPTPDNQDLSVSVMQIVALRAASNAGIPVSEQVINKAVGYVRQCAGPSGGYGYEGPGSGPQTTAAGVLSLQLLGKFDDPNLAPSMAYLSNLPVTWNAAGCQYFYYFHYYAMQAMYQTGGKQWNDWHPKVRELFLKHQNADGSWDLPPGTAENEGVVGPNKVYWTAMSCLVLDIYLHFLPAYQR